MKIRIKLNPVCTEMLQPTIEELRSLGYTIISLPDDNDLVIEKDASKIDSNKELWGFDQLYGIKDMQYD